MVSGEHNFTIDTLFDIQKVLGITLLNVGAEESKPNPRKQYRSLKKTLLKEKPAPGGKIIIGKIPAVKTKLKYKINLEDHNSVNEI